MLPAETSYPIHTLDQQVLLEAGCALTEQSVVELAAQGSRQAFDRVPLLGHATVKADIERFLDIPPYNEIFAHRTLIDHLMAHMQDVVLPQPLLKALDFFRQHDFHTYRHILTVFCLSSMLIHELYAAGERGSDDFMAGPTHDFGKICVPLHILKKSSPLTREERCILDHHPLAGYVLLSYYLGDHEHPAARIALEHHERSNGSGYPCGKTSLSPTVEIIAACDVYDALLSPRPYRPLSYDNRTALEELTRMAQAGELGWQPVEALVAANRLGRPHPGGITVSLDRRGEPPVGNCYGQLADE